MAAMRLPRVKPRRFSPEDSFFDMGNVQRERYNKYSVCVPDEHDMDLGSSFTCPEPNCNIQLSSVFEHEVHYESNHMHVCSCCNMRFGTNRILELHISEIHDAYFKVLSAHQDMYECLVEGCPVRSSSDRSRKQHLVKDHSYPMSFEFHRKAPKTKKRGGKKASKGGAAKSVPKPTNSKSDASQQPPVSIDSADMEVLVPEASPHPPTPTPSTSSGGCHPRDDLDETGIEVEEAEGGQRGGGDADEIARLKKEKRKAAKQAQRRRKRGDPRNQTPCRFYVPGQVQDHQQSPEAVSLGAPGSASVSFGRGCRAGAACPFLHSETKPSPNQHDELQKPVTASSPTVGTGGGAATLMDVDENLDDIVSHMSSLKLVPRNISFGGRGRR